MNEYTIKLDIITPDGRRLTGSRIVDREEVTESLGSHLQFEAEDLLYDVLEALYEDENKIDE